MTAPSVPTIKRLFAVSGNRCAFPSCHLPVVDQASSKVTGRISHIKARRCGGPRYDPNQTDEQRHSFENLLLLCPIHHDVIDADPKSYTVERLLEIKSNHEIANAGGDEPNDCVAVELISLSVVQIPVIHTQYQSGGQTAQQITNIIHHSVDSAQWAQDIEAKRQAHDLDVFRRSDAILDEDILLPGFSTLIGDHSYRESFRNPVAEFCDFFIKAQNQYLDSNLASLSSDATTALRRLVSFIAKHFFIYPKHNQDFENIRYCLYPELNVDRAGSGDPDEMDKYDNYGDQLEQVVRNAEVAYRSYRKAIKEKLIA